jgi:flagellar motor switch/type III secretory pathway protein FliN
MMQPMSEPGSISAFPWAALERVPRSAARTWGRLQRTVTTSARDLAAPLALALGRWLGEPVHFEWISLHSGSDDPQNDSTRLRFRIDPGPIDLTLAMDRRLTIRLVAHALNHRSTLYDTRQPLEEELLGAAAAVVLHMFEEARLGLAIELLDAPLNLPDAMRAHLEATIRVDANAYRIAIALAISPLCSAAAEVWAKNQKPAKGRSSASGASALPHFTNWARLGNIPVALPLVIGTSLVTRDVLAELAPGKAFLSGSGLWVNAARVGYGVLIAPCSDRGVRIELEPGDKIVLRGANVTLDHDEPTQTVALLPQVPSIADALRDAPVVLRVELGAVSLPAQQWAELRVGDIVETGKPLGSTVVLRVAGQALAEGELLNIDGELGVRITRLLTEDP